MLTLSSGITNLKSPSVLYLCHPKDDKSPDTLRAMQTIISTGGKQLAKIGETILTQARFDEFQTVVLTPSALYQKDLLTRLVRSEWKERLLSLVGHPKKLVIVLGNSIQISGPKVLIIPKDQTVFMNQLARSHNYDVDTPGLGLARYRYDINYDPEDKQEFYNRLIRQLSSQEPIFLMDSSVVVSNDRKVQFGSLYKAWKGEIKKIRDLPEDVNPRSQHIIQEKEMITPTQGQQQITSEQDLKAAYEAMSKGSFTFRR